MKEFVHGETYRVDQFVDQSWGPDLARVLALDPSTLFRYEKPEGAYHGQFVEVVEEPNPLISSEQAQQAVEGLREQGMSYRQISRLAGVSVEAVYRSANGVGRIRATTQKAILQVASSLNGSELTKT